jgi:hypothetical protein
MLGLSRLLNSEKPVDIDFQDTRERSELVVENMAVIVLDFRDGGTIKLYTYSSEPPRERILGECRILGSTPLRNTLHDNVFGFV